MYPGAVVVVALGGTIAMSPARSTPCTVGLLLGGAEWEHDARQGARPQHHIPAHMDDLPCRERTDHTTSGEIS